MKVEISKSQKDALGKKIDLCVNFLKSEVQPHIVKSDTIIINMSDSLDLFITSSKIYVTETKLVVPAVNFSRKRTLLLEKQDRKQAKSYICEVAPELAVEFLKNWETARNQLEEQVDAKTKQVDELNQFVDDFKL